MSEHVPCTQTSEPCPGTGRQKPCTITAGSPSPAIPASTRASCGTTGSGNLSSENQSNPADFSGSISRGSPDPRVVVKTMSQIVSAHEPEALGPHLPTLRAPVLLLYGAGARNPKNLAISPEERATLRTIPKFEQEDVASAGQYIQEEQPDRVVAAVKRIFTGTRE